MAEGNDQDLWQSYAKGVRRLDAAPDPAPAPKKKPRPAPIAPPTPLPEPFIPAPQTPLNPACLTDAALDERIERNLKQGEVFIEARLDLHGKTLQEAHEALVTFIKQQAARGKKLVLVITGKGREETGPVLKTEIPRWCAEPDLASKIQAMRPAAPNHGGNGAYYLLLRR